MKTTLLNELIPSVHKHLPYPQAGVTDRPHTAIVGISRGGFSCDLLLALRSTPTMFSYAAGMSPAIDFAQRPFRWRQYGLLDAVTQRHSALSDSRAPQGRMTPLVLLKSSAHPLALSVYVDLWQQRRDVLLDANKRFVDAEASSKANGDPASFSIADGGHDWSILEFPAVPALRSEALLAHLQHDAARSPQRLQQPSCAPMKLNPLDWLLLALLAYSIVKAFLQGFFRSAFALAGLIVGLALWRGGATQVRLRRISTSRRKACSSMRCVRG